MYIKIYFADRPLFLCDKTNREIDEYSRHDDAVFMDDFSNPSINSIIHEMRLDKVHAGIFVHKDLEALRKAFWKKFIVIKAAGGLVQNEKGELLFMLRRGVWDLPKGKLDNGETLEQCAIREVGEETGLQKIGLDNFLLATYHTYDESGKHFLKESSWYRMKAAGDQALMPQQEEQITELKWIAPKQLGAYLRNTYPSIVDVLTAAGYTAK
jgi:8-oxo-dGTP pyrophosphatase MutT (NUDIX family)